MINADDTRDVDGSLRRSSLKAVLLSASTTIEVPFHDVDAMLVSWHGHYVKYFEIARAALLRAFDYDYPQMQASGYAWPVVDLHVKYVRPARYGQRLLVKADLMEFENRLRIVYEIRDADSALRLTKGQTIQVAVDLGSHELQFVTPAVVREKLLQAGVSR